MNTQHSLHNSSIAVKGKRTLEHYTYIIKYFFSVIYLGTTFNNAFIHWCTTKS